MKSIHFAFWAPRGRTFTHVFEGPHEGRSTALIKCPGGMTSLTMFAVAPSGPDAIFFSDNHTREELVVVGG